MSRQRPLTRFLDGRSDPRPVQHCTGTQPCDKCIETGSNCLFTEALDRRRKYAQKRAEQHLDATQQLLDRIVEAFGEGDIAQLSWLLSTVKERGTDEQLKDGITGEEPGTAILRKHIASPKKKDLSEALRGRESEKSNVQAESFSQYRARRTHSVDSSSSSKSVGSLNEVDTLTEDPNRNEETRATGYIGKGSEIAWMQKLDSETINLNRDWHQQVSPLGDTVTPMSYHLDNLQIAEPLSIAGDARALPPKSWAAQLLNIYFESVGPTFPLIEQQLFVSQFNSAFIDTTQQPPQKWLAVLNLVLAIAAKYYQLAEPDSGRDVDDHVFLSRAIALTTTRWLAIQHADLHQVQIDLLLAIYYLASGQINRSWQIAGRAARSAIALGLNLREVSGQIDPVSKETRTRLWWSIFHLEHLLSGMTGRSTCVDYRALSVYPPAPYDEREFQTPEVAELLGNTALREERLQWTIYASDSTLQSRNQWFSTLSPSQSLYFFHLVDLSIITHAAVTSIYSLTAGKDSGQSGISHYQEKLQTWLSNLQPPFAFTDRDNQLDISRQSREQVSLALSYYSAQIILSRPCLTCPDFMEGRNIRVPRSRFGNATAKTCVDTALALISVFPDAPDMEWLLKMTPWCSVLHFMMQALIILLIQLSVGPVEVMTTHSAQSGQRRTRATENPEAILGACKKILRWLHCMAEQDASARRAFKICNNFIRRIAPAKEFNLHGIPLIASLPEHTSGFRSSQSKLRESKDDTGSGSVPRGSQKNKVNWGPDRTVNEVSLDDHRQDSFSLDPALFSWVDMIEDEDCPFR
ncbi:FAD linked oxidase N-terminal [Penicillium atrosanguineum]|uniref:FAD linked oxidase N-terminal n=1 Tax=Penicillium atrosanguineum TaxID=1132637 RepID=UPI0023A271C6|nr:FAD linked oxidase N-terminal [Penicillium atrosanguineum]KAJ5298981.1 FAD linked oxidase N-terminal [Penicillium atrosanguineum]